MRFSYRSFQQVSNKKKENGVVYTPSWIVKEILDLSRYKNNIYNKKVMEPGCGEGAFLIEILKRIIIDAKNNNITNQKISKLINDNIYGVDIDEKSIAICKAKLNKICQGNQIDFPIWDNIKTIDLLSKDIIEEYRNAFDFVFGNPPYVRIQNLSQKTREFINTNLTVCKNGSTDLYLAFFELGHLFLKGDGLLGYITPNTFLNSSTGKETRKYIQNIVETFVDFEHYQIFENATTYSLITILNNRPTKNLINLYKGNLSSIRYDGDLNIKRFGDNNWILEKESILNKIDEIKKRGKALGERAKIHTGLATLKDELFIFKNPTINGDVATITLKNGKTFDVEKNILKKIIKASTWKNAQENQQLFIIFPYKQINGKYEIITEKEMEQNYPLTLKYFQSVRKELEQRDKGDKNKLAKYPSWYAFGRSQGIDTSFGKKIITAGINLKPRFIVCEEEDTTYYAGYSIHYDGDLYQLAAKLNSEDMEYFIKYSSRDYQGDYKSYSKSFIKDFGVEI
jgi:adenine-specific DNA-methyltransferase